MCASSSKMSLGNMPLSYIICVSRKAVFMLIFMHIFCFPLTLELVSEALQAENKKSSLH